MRDTTSSIARASRLLLVGLLVAACSASGGGSPAPSAPPGTPVPSAVTAADAAAIVLALDSRFAGIDAHDPGMIGQGSWYEVAADATGWRVTVQVGWGDCPTGCIYRHTWGYAVTSAGAASKLSETGDALTASDAPTGSMPIASLPAASAPPAASAVPAATTPPAPTLRPTPTARPTPTKRPAASAAPSPTGGSGVPPIAIPTTGGPWLVGVATASPVCPVERYPPDPACAPRPVVGATIVVRDLRGQEVGRATTGTDGTYRVAVPAGSIRVEATPLAGLMRAPAPVDAVVPAGPGASVRVDLSYDTGIR